MNIASKFSKLSRRLFGFLKDVRLDVRGATAIEYSLIAAGIAMAIVVIVFTLGGQVEGTFQSVVDEFLAYF